jgi:hypothetical protein
MPVNFKREQSDMTSSIARLPALASLLIVATSLHLSAQSPDTINLSTIGKDPRCKVTGRTVSAADIKGKLAIKMSEGSGIGVVWLDGYDFANGVIEVDLLGRSQPVQGSFVGVAFRIVDAQTFDAVYFRPFNFRATDSTRHSHAVEYVSEPQWPWEKLRAEHPGEYEKALEPAPDGDEWFHARVVVARPKVSVFVNGATQPSLVVNELSNRTHGSVGLWVGEGSGGNFANLRVTRTR